MGNKQSEYQQVEIPPDCKIYSQLSLDSPSDQEMMEKILERRYRLLSSCPHICTLSGHQTLQEEPDLGDISCRSREKLIIFYQAFEQRLSQIPSTHRFSEPQILRLILCISLALTFFYKNGIPYGDVCPDNICRRANNWMLIDKAFLKNGISAYEKVLEGEPSYVSPKQMERIRHGLIRESPQITEEDDIFALGLVGLQMASGRASRLCYSDSNLRLNSQILGEHHSSAKNWMSPKMMNLLERMLTVEEDERITLRDLVDQCQNWQNSQPPPSQSPNRGVVQAKSRPANDYNQMRLSYFESSPSMPDHLNSRFGAPSHRPQPIKTSPHLHRMRIQDQSWVVTPRISPHYSNGMPRR